MKTLYGFTRERALPERAGYGKQRRIRINVGLICFDGQEPYFSVTCDVFHPQARDIDAGGCLHDLAAKYFRWSTPLIALHLRDINGVPLHAVANAQYWIKEGNAEALASHLGLTLEEAKGVISDAQNPDAGPSVARILAESLCRGLAPEWQRQAAAGIEVLKRGCAHGAQALA